MIGEIERTGVIALAEAELTGEIIGAAVAVHRVLGPGVLESAYQTCMCRELTLRNVPFRSQVELPVEYIRMPSGLRVPH